MPLDGTHVPPRYEARLTVCEASSVPDEMDLPCLPRPGMVTLDEFYRWRARFWDYLVSIGLGSPPFSLGSYLLHLALAPEWLHVRIGPLSLVANTDAINTTMTKIEAYLLHPLNFQLGNEWSRVPEVRLPVRVDPFYVANNGQAHYQPSMVVHWVLDTGASKDTIPFRDVAYCLSTLRLQADNLRLVAANGEPLESLGTFNAVLTLWTRSCVTTIHVVKKLTCPLLSLTTCTALGLIESGWPDSRLRIMEKAALAQFQTVGDKYLDTVNLSRISLPPMAPDMWQLLLKHIALTLKKSVTRRLSDLRPSSASKH